TNTSVFIHGESGTGKELVARALHDRSSRKDGPFVAISCPSIPRELIEAELFGHEKGAYTGAHAERSGHLELANGGTLFLDEIGDMDLATQTKLLRVLQEREFTRVGGRQRIHVDLRLVAATSRNIAEEIRAGRFREDLYYRIGVVPIEMPPLRARVGDIPLLVRHFLHEISARAQQTPPAVEPRALRQLCAYDWPGNVRELRNVVEYLVAMHSDGAIRFEALPERIRSAVAGPDAGDLDLAGTLTLKRGETLEARLMSVEGSILREALERCGWNQSLAARLLGIKESTLRYKLRRYDIRSVKVPSRPVRRSRPESGGSSLDPKPPGQGNWLH
ncbi:MAG: sigma-54-dependent Fis family transcriptional regulator, partial [Candidatus Eisenbacteria bacterium]|nr:sigma-54-dependent Fis family transcriptional regulator [Candidatus Eisenbacteria bacterium]